MATEEFEDVELEVLKESIQGLSKNTIRSYTQTYDKLRRILDKEVKNSSQHIGYGGMKSAPL